MADSEKKTKRRRKTDLLKSAERGLLPALIEDYIRDCAEREKFPNVAGFCRYCGAGQGELEALAENFPTEYGALCFVFEDEALNSDIAASLVNPYMKKRLGYGDEAEKRKDGDAPTVIFEHDIMKDGE